MKIEYYYFKDGKNILFCTCEEGSVMDTAIKHYNKSRRTLNTKAVKQGKALPQDKSRNIIHHVEGTV